MTFLLRFGSVGGVLAGLALGVPGLIESFTGKTTLTGLFLGVSPFLALPLVVALYLSQARAAGRLATVGYPVILVGTGLFGAAAYTKDIALIHLDDAVVTRLLDGPTRVAFLGSAAVFIAGAVLFGLSMVRAGVLPRVPAWGFTLVLPAFAVVAGLPYGPYKGIMHALAAAVLIWLAVSVPGETPDGPQASLEAVRSGRATG